MEVLSQQICLMPSYLAALVDATLRWMGGMHMVKLLSEEGESVPLLPLEVVVILPLLEVPAVGRSAWVVTLVK